MIRLKFWQQAKRGCETACWNLGDEQTCQRILPLGKHIQRTLVDIKSLLLLYLISDIIYNNNKAEPLPANTPNLKKLLHPCVWPRGTGVGLVTNRVNYWLLGPVVTACSAWNQVTLSFQESSSAKTPVVSLHRSSMSACRNTRDVGWRILPLVLWENPGLVVKTKFAVLFRSGQRMVICSVSTLKNTSASNRPQHLEPLPA